MAKEKEDKVLLRLKKVEGQIKGVRKMYEENKGCFNIIHQITAIKSALSSVASLILSEESVKCVREKDSKRLSKILKELVKNS